MINNIGNILKNFVSIGVIILAFIGVYHLFKCGGHSHTIVGETVDTLYVEKIDTVEKYIPEITTKYLKYTDTLYVRNDIIVEIPQILTKQDTLDLIDSYFTKNIYIDSLSLGDNGENGYVILEDEIWKNTIYSRKYTSYMTERIIEKETVVKELDKRLNLFLGLDGNLSVGIEDYGVYDNELLMPKGYIGAQYRFGDSHYIKAEADAFRKDIRFGYSFDNGRLIFSSEYSTKFTNINGGLKFYLIK